MAGTVGRHGHHWGRRGWGGGLGPDDDDNWGATFRDGGGPEGWGGDIRGKRFFIRSVLSHVNATPAQERAIGAAFEEFRGDMKKLGGGETRRSRQEIADALRQPTFDGVVMGEQFARHDTVIEGARKAFVGPGRARARRARAGTAHAAGHAGRAGPALRLVAVTR